VGKRKRKKVVTDSIIRGGNFRAIAGKLLNYLGVTGVVVTIYQEGCCSIIGGRSDFAAGLADIGNFLPQIYRFDADAIIDVIIPGGFDDRVIFLLIGIGSVKNLSHICLG